MASFKPRSDQPLDGLSGVPFEGACLFRMDVLSTITATTPNSHNWHALEGGTISGGIWNTKTAPNLSQKFIRAATGAGGSGSACSHSHNLNVSAEVLVGPCAGTGTYLVTSSSTQSTSQLPAYYDLEIWIRTL